jgi:uroporphyrinogen decarboxylase
MVEVGDDLGGKDNLLISPEMYREFIKPAELELYSLIHEKAPEAALFHHTDGAVFDLIPDLIEVGVNVLNPVQTSAKGMEARRLKEAHGNSIVFHGAIENVESDVSAAEIITEVKQRIDTLSPGGGYVLSCCNHMMDVTPENIISMFQTAREYGHYKK